MYYHLKNGSVLEMEQLAMPFQSMCGTRTLQWNVAHCVFRILHNTLQKDTQIVRFQQCCTTVFLTGRGALRHKSSAGARVLSALEDEKNNMFLLSW
jgi:L-asparaginase II